MTNDIYEEGFNPSGDFYETTKNSLEMTSSQLRADGTDTDIFFTIAECSLGSILIAQSKKGVCAILIGDDPASLVLDLQDQFPKANLIGDEPRYEDVAAKVVELVEHPGARLDLPLDIRGTTFQQRVGGALQQIPPGSTATYTEVAREIGMPKAVQAVAQACASNVLAVVIPRHRVVRADGAPSGYRWGVERKSALLEREAHA